MKINLTKKQACDIMRETVENAVGTASVRISVVSESKMRLFDN